jgi:hypothetical protein
MEDCENGNNKCQQQQVVVVVVDDAVSVCVMSLKVGIVEEEKNKF